MSRTGPSRHRPARKFTPTPLFPSGLRPHRAVVRLGDEERAFGLGLRHGAPPLLRLLRAQRREELLLQPSQPRFRTGHSDKLGEHGQPGQSRRSKPPIEAGIGTPPGAHARADQPWGTHLGLQRRAQRRDERRRFAVTCTPSLGNSCPLLAPNSDKTEMIRSHSRSAPISQFVFQPTDPCLVGRIRDRQQLGAGIAAPHGLEPDP
jgi:hypothetical protein